MSASFALAGALIFVALALALVALGLLHFAQAKVKTMSVADEFKAVAADFIAAVEELKTLDLAAFVQKVRDDGAAVVSSIEADLTGLLPTFQTARDDVRNVVSTIKAALNPPAPVVEEAAAEQPAA